MLPQFFLVLTALSLLWAWLALWQALRVIFGAAGPNDANDRAKPGS